MSIAVFIGLLIEPVFGLGMAALFGMQGAARHAGVTESSMPSTVMTTVLANEYLLEPSLVTAIIFVGTILSPLTLTPGLYYLGR